MRRLPAWRWIEKPRTNVPFQDTNSYDESADMDTYIETQTKILQSETLALQTIKSMDLAQYPEFGGNPAAGTFGQGALAKAAGYFGSVSGRSECCPRAQQPSD